MNNPNPFVPKGSLLEQQSQRRSRLQLAVFCVILVSCTGLVAMLIQGCKREKPADDLALNADTNAYPPMVDNSTNPPLAVDTNPYVPPTPMATNPLPPTVENVAAGSEYSIVQGDTLAKIAKAHGVTLKALEAANPGVDSRKLKIKQKIMIPAGGKTGSDNSSVAAPVSDSGVEIYKVKNGDTLMKLARTHGTTQKAIMAANNMTSTKIYVGKTLKIPKKAEAAAAAPVPVMDPVSPPPMPVQSTTSSAAPGPVK